MGVDSGHFFAATIGSTLLPALQNDIDAMNIAIQAVSDRTGTGGTVITTRTNLTTTLNQALNFVNNLVRRNQPQAIEIIQSAALLVAGANSGGKFFTATQTVAGEVMLRCKAAMKDTKYVAATYMWQWAKTNTDTTVWTDTWPGFIASETATGLPSAVRIYFRYRIRTADGMGDWSDPISLVGM